MATSPRLAVVAGDRGGWNAIAPVLTLALERGCAIAVFLTATCAKQYAEGTLKIDDRISVFTEDAEDGSDDFMRRAHDLLVICASQSADGASLAAAVADEADKRPILLMEDYYGSAGAILCRVKAGANLTVCVIDEFALRRASATRTTLLGTTYVVTGGPQFDHLAEVRRTWDEQRERLRQAMGVNADDLVFLITGQLNGTAEAVVLIEEAVRRMNLLAHGIIICRTHPRRTWLDQRLLDYCQLSMPRGWFKDPGKELAPSSEALLPAADFVLSGYSTTNYYGILYQMPGVVYLGTPSFCYDLHREKGLDKPIEVEFGAGWYVQSVDDMMYVIEEVQTGDQSAELQRIRAAQAKIAAKNDGQATQRVWEEIQRLIV